MFFFEVNDIGSKTFKVKDGYVTFRLAADRWIVALYDAIVTRLQAQNVVLWRFPVANGAAIVKATQGHSHIEMDYLPDETHLGESTELGWHTDNLVHSHK